MNRRRDTRKQPHALASLHVPVSRLRGLFACCAVVALFASACAPVVPLRSKPGGAARWAFALASQQATLWSTDARGARVKGNGVGNEGWLPDRGGAWTVTFWSASKQVALNVVVDSDGNVSSDEVADESARDLRLPSDWQDSPRVWAATRSAQQGDPLSTLEAELSAAAEPQRYPDQAVWRIRFFTREGQFETHVVSAAGEWLTRY